MTLYSTLRKRRSTLEEYQTPYMDFLGGGAVEGFRMGGPAIGRAVTLQNAMEGEPVGIGGFETGMGEMRVTSPMVDAATARSRIQEEGLDLTVPDAGIRQEALDILIERKSDERRRSDLYNRGPSGFGPSALYFGAALAGSMADPLNIASAFVPVVSQARYARMAARLGATRARLLTGAIEGTAGAAMVEPIVYGAAQFEQADYDLQDSVLNLALGTALGGGLHVGVGAAGDYMARRASRMSGVALEPLPAAIDAAPFEVRESALRTAIGQAVSGRNIDVEPVLRMGGVAPARFGPETRVSVGPDEALDLPGIAAAVDSITPNDVAAVVDGITPDDVAAVVDGIDEIAGDPAAVAAIDEAVSRAADALPDEARQDLGAVAEAVSRGVAQAAPSSTGLGEIGGAAEAIGQNLRAMLWGKVEAGDTTELGKPSAVLQAAKMVRDRGGLRTRPEFDAFAQEHARIASGPNFQRDMQALVQRHTPAPPTPIDLADAGRASFAPENQRLADFDAARAADERLKETPADEAFPQASLEQAAADLHATVAALAADAPEPRHDLMADLRAKLLREIGRGAPPKARQPKSLFQFLADEGGILDPRGDLKAMDLDKVFIPGRGKLVRKAGVRQGRGRGGAMHLDEARRRAVEAGYIFDPGDASGGERQTTVADLLRALGEEASGSKVYSRLDDADVAEIQVRAEYEQVREDIGRAVDEIAEVLTGDIPEAMKRKAVELRLYERLEPEDALERAIMLDEAADDTGTALRYDDGDEVPFDDLPPFDPGRAAQQRGTLPGDGDDPAGQGRAAEGAGDESGVPGGAEGKPGTERTSIGDQFVIPGAEREGLGTTLQRRADRPLLPKAEQRLSMEEGLFGDAHKQRDMFDAVMREVEAMADALGDPGMVAREMREASALADNADTWGRAARAAADCQLRKGDA